MGEEICEQLKKSRKLKEVAREGDEGEEGGREGREERESWTVDHESSRGQHGDGK